MMKKTSDFISNRPAEFERRKLTLDLRKTSDLCCNNTILSSRRHSWPPFISQVVRQETSGIYDPLEDEETSGSNPECHFSNEIFRCGKHCRWIDKENICQEAQGSGQQGLQFDRLKKKPTMKKKDQMENPQHIFINSLKPKKDDDGLDGHLNHHGSAKALRKLRIAGIFQHYYPEGGWGYIIVVCTLLIQVLGQSVQMSLGMLMMFLLTRRPVTSHITVEDAGWVGALSMCTSLFVSPLIVAICKRKSTRVTAVIGGLVTALGCLFTSFSSQLHQVLTSYGAIMGFGVAMTRDPGTIIIGQYFKRKRDFIEIILVSANGLGIALMSVVIEVVVSTIGWRLGLQVIAGLIVLSFILAIFYRSATLYHPQRRAILHLKSQKRKIKMKEKDKKKFQEETPSFMDFSTLKSKTVQILLCSISLGSFGLYSPFFYFAQQASSEGIRGKSLLWLQASLGIGWALGSCLFGFVVVNNSTECRISKQYLCQASLFMVGVSILAFTAVEGYNGYVVFVWIYGISCGGYNYTLKVYIFEKVRSRNFARVWSFAQFCMALPNLIGIPASGYINTHSGGRSGYYFSATLVLLGSLVMALIDVRRRNLRKLKKIRQNLKENSSKDSKGICQNSTFTSKDFDRPDSSTYREEIFPPNPLHHYQRTISLEDLAYLRKHELTICSEDGLGEMDLPDNFLIDDLDYLDNITSCDKVENCVVLSEYEQNLTKEKEFPHGFHTNQLHRRSRKWSTIFKPQTLQTINSESEEVDNVQVEVHSKVLQYEVMPTNGKKSSFRKFSQEPKRRSMSVIEEASF